MSHWACPSCGRDYSYELAECTWCHVGLERLDPVSGVVTVVTRVDVASIEHEDVPYWVALLTTDDGSLALRKSDTPVCLGEVVPTGRVASAELARFGIVGTGVMGQGLVELLLSRGHTVSWVGRDLGRLQDGRRRVAGRLSRIMEEQQVHEATSRLVVSIGLDVLSECDVVIEAVVEELAPKAAVLAAVERAMRDDAVLTTNTSGLPLDELASALARPERFGALHFFNPPNRMRLVETAVSPWTSVQTSMALDEIASSLGKTPIRVAATPAFAVNRVLMPLLNEAVRELEEGVASAQSIDDAIRLGLNHPMGPLALADLIGLDVVIDIMDNLAARTNDVTYAPRAMLRAMVAEGNLGRKTGEGFYTYEYRPRTT